MNVWKVLKKTISFVLTLAIVLSVSAPVFAEVATLSGDSIGYLAMGDDMSNGIGLTNATEDSYAAKVAKKLYGENWATSYQLRAGSKYRVEELRYLIDEDYNGDGYTAQFFGDIDTAFERDKAMGTVRDEVKNADYITVSAGVHNFSTYIVEQMLYYVENGGKVKYSYDIESVMADLDLQDVDAANAYAQFDNMKSIVKNELMAAAGDTMDKGVELVDFVAEVSAYAVLSYIVSFNELINEIYALNPDVEVYVIGIYNPAEGEVLTLTVDGKTRDLAIGTYFGALMEIANAYTQILAPRVYDYTYVHPGNPELLIDVMGNSNIEDINDRIPQALKTKLLESAEETAISMIQEMYAEYGVEKSEKEAEDLAYEIFWAETAEERLEIIKSEINDLAIDEVLERFAAELEKYASTYGDIEVTKDDIQGLLTDLENAADEAARETIATEFVVDLMTKAMVGQTFAGIEIKTQEDAYEAIALLEKNAEAAGGDPAAIREAAAAMVIAEIGEDNALGIDKADVVELLELMDVQTTTEAREEVVDAWLNEKAAAYIAETVQQYVSSYKLEDAKNLLAAMEASTTDDDAAIAKTHLLEHFTPVLAEKMEEKYSAGGFTLQNYDSFEEFAIAINTEDDVKSVVRNEIRAAAADAIFKFATVPAVEGDMPLWGECQCGATHDPDTCSGLSLAMVLEMLTTMDSKTTQEEKDAALHAWLVEYMGGGVEPEPGSFYEIWFFNPVKNKFMDAYNSYNDAATTAENMCANYRDSLDTASEAFGSYADLKAEAADTIITNYEQSYQGAGELAQSYYSDYLKLRDAAVEKVMSGYKEYANAIDKGLSSCDQLNEIFDKVFKMLCEIAEVEAISLNDILAVAKKVQNGGYIQEMVDNLMQGDALAQEDKTVAYLALRYYLADSMMIMPSAAGHQTIANQVIKAINGEDTYSTGGYYANKVIDKAIDVYRCAKAYRDLTSSESGQVGTLINPALYVALGDNITSGSALGDVSKAYPQLVGDALAMAADDRDGADEVNNYAINGMRVEELLMLVDDNYNGDEYTADRFGAEEMAALRAEYREDIANAELITINVGINNLVTYPLTQTMLAYNGEEPYDMDWGRFIGDSRANKINKGMDVAIDLALALVDKAENHSETLDGLSAYERCERALNTMFTAVESMVYSYISYIFTLDDAVEQIATLNTDGTIALIGFYNPLEGTYFRVDRTVTVRGKTVDLSQYEINVDALGNMMVNLANRYLAHYVGSISEDGTAADEGSRLLNVKINDTELFVTNDNSVSKDLSTLTEWKDFTFRGRTITVMVPEYFLQTGKTAGECLHPNEAGHQYITDQILDALDFEIYADVIVEDYTKTYGDADPDFEHLIDDLSSLWNIDVTGITRDEGEDVGEYKLYVQYTAEDGYKEIDEEFGTLTILPREATVTVTIQGGKIINVTYDNVLENDQALLTAETLIVSGEAGNYTVATEDEHILKNYILNIEVVEEEEPVTPTNNRHYINYQVGLIEPWFLRVNLRVADRATTETVDYTQFEDYGAYFIRRSQLDDPSVDKGALTYADLIADADTTAYQKGVEVDVTQPDNHAVFVDGEYLGVRFREGIYTYEMSDPILYVFWYVDGTGKHFTNVVEINLSSHIDTCITNTKFGPLERDVYAKISKLEEDIVDYRNRFEGKKEVEPQTLYTVGQSNLGAPNTSKTYRFAANQQLTLIEPWGLRINVKVTERATGALCDYTTADDYGVILYHSPDGTGPVSTDEMLAMSNAYVFSKSNGNAFVDGEYIGIRYNEDIFTFQLDTTFYYMAYYVVDGQYYYTGVPTVNIYDHANACIADTTGRYPDYEKAVYADMVALCDSVTAYREDYFKNN